MIRGWFSAKWFGSPPENQSYRVKIGVTGQKSEIQPGRALRSEPDHPGPAPELSFGLSTEKGGLKASFNPGKFSSWKKGSLGRGRSGTSAESFVLCFSVFWGDFLLQISQQFLSEVAPPMQAFSGKPPREKPPNAAAGKWNCYFRTTVASKLITDRHFRWGELKYPMTDTASCCQKN